jgi:hypothetical protein
VNAEGDVFAASHVALKDGGMLFPVDGVEGDHAELTEP